MKNLTLPSVRWTVPAAVATAVVIAGSGALSGSGRSSAPPHDSAAGVQLVAAVRSTDVPALSGTVEVTATGLPAGTGSQRARIWLAAPGRARVDVAGPTGRLAVYQDGGRTWVWDAGKRTAIRLTASGKATPALPDPVRTARTLLAQVARASTVTVGDPVTVAGRTARTVVIHPTDRHSLIGSLRLAVDTATRLPLAVEVRPRDADAAVLKVAFTQLRLAAPAANTFRFTPPAGARVETVDVTAAASPLPALIGRGWSTVVSLRAPAGKAFADLVRLLPAVHGDWGRGRLFRSPLVTALITEDGRILAGAVDPDTLYAATR